MPAPLKTLNKGVIMYYFVALVQHHCGAAIPQANLEIEGPFHCALHIAPLGDSTHWLH